MSDQKTAIIETIVNERNRFLYYVRRKINDISDMDAEDIVADVMFNVYSKVDIQPHMEGVLAYIYRAIKNRTIDYRRKASKLRMLDTTDIPSSLPILDNIADDNANIEKQLQRKELRIQLYTALMELEGKQRAVWVATEIEGYTFKELAVKWNEPIGTLLSRKSRATRTLQIKLKDVLKED